METEEIVEKIIDQMVDDIPNHQLDGMSEVEEPQISEEMEENSVKEEIKEEIKKPPMSKESSAESSAESNSEMDNIYHVKWISWNGKKVPIVTQNSNGPCPMLAIANVLLLRGKMALQDGCEVVSSEQLLENLGNFHFFSEFMTTICC